MFSTSMYDNKRPWGWSRYILRRCWLGKLKIDVIDFGVGSCLLVAFQSSWTFGVDIALIVAFMMISLYLQTCQY